jgi:transcriptional regulator with XRE-family HTH domain
MSIAEKVKSLRKQNGYSQEKLAEESGLSLRTIQRVENSETEPRGNTLTRIADVFQVSPDEILDWSKTEDISFLMVLNLTQFSFFFFPLLSVLIPLLLWILKRKTIEKVDEIGKKILNFQISWSIVLFGGTISYFIYIGQISINDLGEYYNALQSSMFIYQIFAASLIAYNVFIIILNTVKIRKDKPSFFHPAIPFLR